MNVIRGIIRYDSKLGLLFWYTVRRAATNIWGCYWCQYLDLLSLRCTINTYSTTFDHITAVVLTPIPWLSSFLHLLRTSVWIWKDSTSLKYLQKQTSDGTGVVKAKHYTGISHMVVHDAIQPTGYVLAIWLYMFKMRWKRIDRN